MTDKEFNEWVKDHEAQFAPMKNHPKICDGGRDVGSTIYFTLEEPPLRGYSIRYSDGEWTVRWGLVGVGKFGDWGKSAARTLAEALVPVRKYREGT